MMLDLEALDRIAMQFEAEWAPNYRYEHLVAFAIQHFDDLDARCAIIPELIMIDLDRRWKHFSFWVKTADDAEEALVRIGELPTPVDYIAESNKFPLELPDEHCTEIIKHDFLIQAGYHIRSTPNSRVPEELVEKVRASNPEITVLLAGDLKFRQSTWGRFTIGRRDVGDPAPYQWSCSQASPKLVCGDLRDTVISRNQALVQYVGRKRVVIKNTSRNRCFMTNNECLLTPGRAAFIDLPATIILNEVEVRLFPIAE